MRSSAGPSSSASSSFICPSSSNARSAHPACRPPRRARRPSRRARAQPIQQPVQRRLVQIRDVHRLVGRRLVLRGPPSRRRRDRPRCAAARPDRRAAGRRSTTRRRGRRRDRHEAHHPRRPAAGLAAADSAAAAASVVRAARSSQKRSDTSAAGAPARSAAASRGASRSSASVRKQVTHDPTWAASVGIVHDVAPFHRAVPHLPADRRQLVVGHLMLPAMGAAAVGGRQRAAQLADGVVEVDLRRALADPQRRADVPERQILVDAQLQRHPLLGRQLVHRRAQRRRRLGRLEPIDAEQRALVADGPLRCRRRPRRTARDRGCGSAPGARRCAGSTTGTRPRRAARRACPSRARTTAAPDRPPRPASRT